MRPYPSNSNSLSPHSRKSTEFLLPNEINIINIDPDEPNETHQLHLPENYVGSSNFTNTLLQSQLSVQPVKKNETLTQNFRETFVQFPEAEEDDYSLSHILAIGRDYCSKIKESSRNITGNKDNANSRVPLPYLNR
ncbi:Uncharacterized protein Fot_36493 [Forsythia ovata]|uniref:Uncharacterized protein n=1 Tax=Forsythia ovata TaxID=205694 RepID=A0ABD1SPJ9_9LAMI